MAPSLPGSRGNSGARSFAPIRRPSGGRARTCRPERWLSAPVSMVRSPSATPPLTGPQRKRPPAIGTPDYTPQSGTLSWADNDTANKTFNVPIVDDTVFEGNETFSATLSAPSCGTTIGANATEIVTIVDNETQPTTLSIGNVSRNEGNSGKEKPQSDTHVHAREGRSGIRWLGVRSTLLGLDGTIEIGR